MDVSDHPKDRKAADCRGSERRQGIAICLRPRYFRRRRETNEVVGRSSKVVTTLRLFWLGNLCLCRMRTHKYYSLKYYIFYRILGPFCLSTVANSVHPVLMV